MQIIKADLGIPTVQEIGFKDGTVIVNTGFTGERDIKLESMTSTLLNHYKHEMSEKEQKRFERLLRCK